MKGKGGGGGPSTRSDDMRQILDYALDHHRDLVRGDDPFSGGPLSPADLQEAADTVARIFRLEDLAADVRVGRDAMTELHTLAMIAWAGGVKAGARYAIHHHGSTVAGEASA